MQLLKIADMPGRYRDIDPDWPDASVILGDQAILAGERRFKIQTKGSLATVKTVRGLAVEKTAEGIVIWGDRNLLEAKESGYQMEGRVSINGQKLRAFTASQLFRVNGKLVDVAILHVCRPKGEI